MAKHSGTDFIDLEIDHSGKAILEYFKQIKDRGAAFKRQFLYAAATDLHELVVDKIPKDKKYGVLAKSLKVGELKNKDSSVFAVFIDNKAKGIKKVDTQNTVVYIRPRRVQDRIKKEIKLLSDRGPWTVDTIPFWPSRKDAVVIQRKVGRRIVEKISKMQAAQKDKVHRELQLLGQKNVDNAITKKNSDFKKAKAIPDVAYEMLTLEFGGGKERGKAMWRTSLLELKPSKMKSVMKRYRQIEQTMLDPRYKNYKKWPATGSSNRIKSAEIKSFIKFQKRLGY